MQPERQKRWQATEVDYDCFPGVKKIPLAVRYNKGQNNKIVSSGLKKVPVSP